MKTFTHLESILLPRPAEEVFRFFAAAENLERITPDWLRFRIVGASSSEVGEGTTIDYRLRWRGVPLRWRTLIEQWRPPVRFVDRQIRGPYRLWVHEHDFEPHPDGTLARDRVTYAVPGGTLTHCLVVGRDVRAIFAHRSSVLRELFG